MFSFLGIVRNGVVVPQSAEPLPEGVHVEIRLEPGNLPATLRAEAIDRLSQRWR